MRKKWALAAAVQAQSQKIAGLHRFLLHIICIKANRINAIKLQYFEIRLVTPDDFRISIEASDRPLRGSHETPIGRVCDLAGSGQNARISHGNAASS